MQDVTFHIFLVRTGNIILFVIHNSTTALARASKSADRTICLETLDTAVNSTQSTRTQKNIGVLFYIGRILPPKK